MLTALLVRFRFNGRSDDANCSGDPSSGTAIDGLGVS